MASTIKGTDSNDLIIQSGVGKTVRLKNDTLDIDINKLAVNTLGTSTDNAVVRFDGLIGKVQNSGVIIDDNNNVTTAGYVKSGYSQITGSGFTGTFAADATGIYTDVGNTNYRICAGGAERMRIDSSGNVGIGVTPLLNAHTTSVGNSIFTINKNILISGADYKHKYLILTKVPTYGNVNQYVSLKGKYIAERTNGPVGVNIDINFSIGYGNSITFDSIKLGNSSNVELVQVSYNGNQYLALYWYSASNAFSSKFIGELTNYDYYNQITTDFLTHYETNSAVHSSIGYNRQGIVLNGNMTLDASGNLNVGTSGNTAHCLSKTVSENSLIMVSGNNTKNSISTWAVSTYGDDSSNGTATAFKIGKNSTTSRSINAVGTINASGADYAEYEYSNGITLVKGQIVGFKADGTLTDKYSESIRYAIKSTNPSIVGGDVWGCEETVGKRPEQPVKTEGMTDEEFAKLEEQYEKDLADFEARLEVERQKVDRIAYAGKVPVNVYGAVAGQYVIAIEKEDGTIGGKLVNKADMTFAEYQDAVGRVNKILDDGRAEVAVIIH